MPPAWVYSSLPLPAPSFQTSRRTPARELTDMPSTRNKPAAYISSTLADLADERQAVKNALSRHYAVVESYEADSGTLRQSCVDDVQNCALYIGIFGLRY